MAAYDIDLELAEGRVQGTCDDAFAPVLDAFVANFRERNELGASVCLTVDGETRVDLWGGIANERSRAPWQADTISVLFSCTKGATALAAHLLIDRGLLDPHAPVAEYWPEFACNGKQDATVSMMLDHTVGVPALREPVKEGGSYDWDYMCGRLAAEAPFWEPGTRNGYHMLTFGWTVGELVRRVSGRSLGTFFREEIAAPLGIDFWIGLPESEEPRVARMIPWRPKAGDPMMPFTRALVADRHSLQALALMNNGTLVTDSRAAHAAEIGGGGGIGNARSLAGMYAPLANGGALRGVRLVGNDTVVRASQVAVATPCDATLLMPSRFGAGFMKSMDNRHRPTGDIESVILSERAFGHVGAGGSIGFADPECGMSFGYSMNRMGAGILLNARGQSLVDAAYRCMGYAGNAPGVWTR